MADTPSTGQPEGTDKSQENASTMLTMPEFTMPPFPTFPSFQQLGKRRSSKLAQQLIDDVL